MSNTKVTGYVHEPKLTTNLTNFQNWVIEQSGATFKSKAAQEAFTHGLYVGVKSYSHYQAEKNADKRAARLAAQTAPAKPARTRRTKAA